MFLRIIKALNPWETIYSSLISIWRGLGHIMPYLYNKNKSFLFSRRMDVFLVFALEAANLAGMALFSQYGFGVDFALQRNMGYLIEMNINFLMFYGANAVIALLQKTLLVKISNSVAGEMFDDLTAKYVDQKAKPFLYVDDYGRDSVRREHVLLHNSHNISTLTVDLAYQAIKSSFGMAFSVWMLSNMLEPLQVKPYNNIFANIYMLPFFPVSVIVAYAFIVNFSTTLTSRKMSSLQSRKRENYSSVMEVLQDIEKNRDPIASLNAEEFELRRLKARSKSYFDNEGYYEVVRNFAEPVWSVISKVNMVLANLILMPYVEQQKAHHSAFGTTLFHLNNVVRGVSFWYGLQTEQTFNLKKRIDELEVLQSRLDGIIENKKKCEAIEKAGDASEHQIVIHEMTMPLSRSGAVLKKKNCDIIINLGQVTRIQAKSGFGKSVFLKTLVGLMENSRIDWERPSSFTKDNVAFISQKPLDMNFSVEDLLLYPDPNLLPREREKRLKNAKILMQKFKIDDAYVEDMSRNVRGMSGGEKRRMLLINALIKKPKILLMDEALNGIEFSLKMEIQKYLKELCIDEGLTILFVEHGTEADMLNYSSGHNSPDSPPLFDEFGLKMLKDAGFGKYEDKTIDLEVMFDKIHSNGDVEGTGQLAVGDKAVAIPAVSSSGFFSKAAKLNAQRKSAHSGTVASKPRTEERRGSG